MTSNLADKPAPNSNTNADTFDPLVTIHGVNKHFGALHVLKNIDLEIGRGEVVVVIGPSGSGKSTLCRTINRLEAIDNGTIALDGVPLPAEGATRRHHHRTRHRRSPVPTPLPTAGHDICNPLLTNLQRTSERTVVLAFSRHQSFPFPWLHRSGLAVREQRGPSNWPLASFASRQIPSCCLMPLMKVESSVALRAARIWAA
jgi:ABC-type dipeptide/oligopeptide/nickel transport system ATPase component